MIKHLLSFYANLINLALTYSDSLNNRLNLLQAVGEAAILKGHMFPPLCIVLLRFPLISAIKSQLTSDPGN